MESEFGLAGSFFPFILDRKPQVVYKEPFGLVLKNFTKCV